MSSDDGFWDVGPHAPVPVEPLWQEFVIATGGELVASLLPGSQPFENADFLFRDAAVVAELKEIGTEFAQSVAFARGFDIMMKRLLAERPSWRPDPNSDASQFPAWFQGEFVRLFRPPISRILKKANRQLRDTKTHFRIASSTGVLILVNDGFTSLSPYLVRGLAADLLRHSYSSVDCLLYLTVNRYVEIHGSKEPKLIWVPTYSDRAPDALVTFINDLGRTWFDFISQRIGDFSPREESESDDVLVGSRAILLPGEDRG